MIWGGESEKSFTTLSYFLSDVCSGSRFLYVTAIIHICLA